MTNHPPPALADGFDEAAAPAMVWLTHPTGQLHPVECVAYVAPSGWVVLRTAAGIWYCYPSHRVHEIEWHHLDTAKRAEDGS